MCYIPFYSWGPDIIVSGGQHRICKHIGNIRKGMRTRSCRCNDLGGCSGVLLGSRGHSCGERCSCWTPDIRGAGCNTQTRFFCQLSLECKHPSAFLFKHQDAAIPKGIFLIDLHAWKLPQCHHPIAISGQLLAVAQAVSEQALDQLLSKVCLLPWA